MAGRRAAVSLFAGLVASLLAPPARADTVSARCELTTRLGTLTRTLPCTYSQRQGHIGVGLPDGKRYEFSPSPASGRLRSAQGEPVQQVVLGLRGQRFRWPGTTLDVLWDRSGLPGVSFDRALAGWGVGFRVESANDVEAGRVRVTPHGLSIDNTAVERPIAGHVADAQVGDIDRDGSPEVYIVVRSSAADQRASLIALSSNRRRSLSDIVLPDLSAHPHAARGWRGHDRFALTADGLQRRFPLYAAADADDAPTLGVREVHYRLMRGQSSWRLSVDRVVDRHAAAAAGQR